VEKYYVISWDCVFKKTILGIGTKQMCLKKPKCFMPYMTGQLVISCNLMIQKLLICY
jgi:hypothetical protein